MLRYDHPGQRGYATSGLSSDGVIGQVVDNHIVLSDLAVGQQYATGIKVDRFYNILWSPLGRYAVVKSATDSYIVDYVRKKIFRSPAGICNPLWTADNKYLLYSGALPDSTVQHIYLMNSQSGCIEQLSTNDQPPAIEYMGIRVALTARNQIAWMSIKTDIADGMISKTPVLHIYDIASQNMQVRRIDYPVTDAFYDFYFSYMLSPDAIQLGIVREGPEVFNLTSGIHTYVSPYEGSMMSEHGGEVSWSADSQWMITFDRYYLSPVFRFTIEITDRVGQHRRQLEKIAFVTPGSVRWLPLEFNLDNLGKLVS